MSDCAICLEKIRVQTSLDDKVDRLKIQPTSIASVLLMLEMFASYLNKKPCRLPCGHVFHFICVLLWNVKSTKDHPDCPMCREIYCGCQLQLLRRSDETEPEAEAVKEESPSTNGQENEQAEKDS